MKISVLSKSFEYGTPSGIAERRGGGGWRKGTCGTRVVLLVLFLSTSSCPPRLQRQSLICSHYQAPSNARIVLSALHDHDMQPRNLQEHGLAFAHRDTPHLLLLFSPSSCSSRHLADSPPCSMLSMDEWSAAQALGAGADCQKCGSGEFELVRVPSLHPLFLILTPPLLSSSAILNACEQPPHII